MLFAAFVQCFFPVYPIAHSSFLYSFSRTRCWPPAPFRLFTFLSRKLCVQLEALHGMGAGEQSEFRSLFPLADEMAEAWESLLGDWRFTCMTRSRAPCSQFSCNLAPAACSCPAAQSEGVPAWPAALPVPQGWPAEGRAPLATFGRIPLGASAQAPRPQLASVLCGREHSFMTSWSPPRRRVPRRRGIRQPVRALAHLCPESV